MVASPSAAELRSSSAGFLRSAFRVLAANPILTLSALFLVVIVTGAVFADLLAPYDPLRTNLRARGRPPSTMFLLGADEQGRDILSRVLYGTRITLLMSFVSLSIGLAAGAVIGFAAAYFRRLDMLIMRMIDVVLSFPAILMGLAIAGAVGPGLTGIIIALSVSTIGPAARIARSAALTVVSMDYVAAAGMAGLRHWQILVRYVLGNCASTIIVYGTLRFGQVILLGASLSFLGLGISAPAPELGVMVSQGRALLLTAPHVALVPCCVILLLVLSCNIVGDALRDALDPQLQA